MRGWWLTSRDRERGWLIQHLMCRGTIDSEDFAQTFRNSVTSFVVVQCRAFFGNPIEFFGDLQRMYGSRSLGGGKRVNESLFECSRGIEMVGQIEYVVRIALLNVMSGSQVEHLLLVVGRSVE